MWRDLALAGVIGTAIAIGSGANPALAYDPYRPSRVIEWNNVALQAIRDTRTQATIAARALFIVHTAEFDAWAAYDGDAVPSVNMAPPKRPEHERTRANKEIAISYAAYRTLVDLFPTQTGAFEAKMRALGLDPNYVATDRGTPAGIGNSAAQAVLVSRYHDGANQLGDLNPGAYSDYTNYKAVNTPDRVVDIDRWQPLRLCDGNVQTYLTPHWGLVRPFALKRGSEIRDKEGPNEFPQKDFFKEAEAIIDVSAGLDDRKKVIVDFWAQNPGADSPPGQWNRLSQFVAQRDRHDLDEDVQLYFALNGALLDASIAAWETKRFYDSSRPITVVRTVYKDRWIRAWGGPGRGTRWILGQDWSPYQRCVSITPPFPEHTSGHSTFSAAAAEILKRFTGKDDFGASVTIPPNSLRVEPGVPAAPVTLSWKKFKDAAEEAGESRILGGIHFDPGNERGRNMGKKVGEKAWKEAERHFKGK